MASLTTSGYGPWFAWRETADGKYRERFYFYSHEAALSRAADWIMAQSPGERIGTGLAGTGDIPDIIYPSGCDHR